MFSAPPTTLPDNGTKAKNIPAIFLREESEEQNQLQFPSWMLLFVLLYAKPHAGATLYLAPSQGEGDEMRQ